MGLIASFRALPQIFALLDRQMGVVEKLASAAHLQAEAAIRLTEHLIPEPTEPPSSWTNATEIPFTPIIGRRDERSE